MSSGNRSNRVDIISIKKDLESQRLLKKESMPTRVTLSNKDISLLSATVSKSPIIINTQSRSIALDSNNRRSSLNLSSVMPHYTNNRSQDEVRESNGNTGRSLLSKSEISSAKARSDKFSWVIEEEKDENRIGNPRLKKLWGKVQNVVKAIFSSHKMNRNLQLYGMTDDIMNKTAYLKSLKRIQTSLEDKDSTENKTNTFCKAFPVFAPGDKSVLCWNVLVFLLMFYTATVMPYRVSFIEVDGPYWLLLEDIIDIIFFLDVLFTINLGYFDKDNIFINSRKKIFLNYLKSWLVVDLLASFPQRLVLNTEENADYFRLARVTRIYRLIRILRFLKIAKFFRQMAIVGKIHEYYSINYGVKRIVTFLITTIIISHCVACLWHIIPRIYDERYNWITQNDFQDEDPFRLYLFSIYWSLATLFTVGFGDIHAYNCIEYVISILWMIFGVVFYSFTIGTLSSVLASMDTRENITKSKLALLNQFSSVTSLSSSLKDEIKKTLIFNSHKQNVFSWSDKQEIFNDLPANLKFEIANSMRDGLLKDILFFKTKSDSFIAMIVPFLNGMNFSRNEIIYKKGDYPKQIYFLTEGRVLFVNEKYLPFREMIKGSYFGETEIISQNKRSFTVFAYGNCDTLTLARHIYENIICKEFPEIQNQIEKTSQIRSLKLNQSLIECNERSKNLQHPI